MESVSVASVDGSSEACPAPSVAEPRRVLADAIILAGAHPWAERSLESAVYRPLVPIASRPLICHTLDWLRAGNIRAASVCANGDTVLLRKRLQDGAALGVELEYYEDVMPRGPAGCARDVAVGSPADVFIVLEGSILPSVDIDHLLKRHAESGAVLTVVVTPARRARLDSRRALEPAGIYVFSKSAFEQVPSTGYQDIKETLIPRLYSTGERVETYLVEPLAVPSVTGLSSYLAISERAVEHLLADPATDGNYTRMGEARVHISVRMAASVRLIGPVLIERGCVLEDQVVVVGPATIGRGSTVGREAVISRSVLWSQCRVGAGAVLDHCIVTDRANVQAGRSVHNAVIFPETSQNLVERWLKAWRPAVRMSEPRRPAHRVSPADREPERISDRPGREARTPGVCESGSGWRLERSPVSEVNR